MKSILSLSLFILLFGAQVLAAEEKAKVYQEEDPVGDVLFAPLRFLGEVFSGEGAVVYDPDRGGYYSYGDPYYRYYNWPDWDNPWYWDRYRYYRDWRHGPYYYNYWYGDSWPRHRYYHHHHRHHRSK